MGIRKEFGYEIGQYLQNEIGMGRLPGAVLAIGSSKRQEYLQAFGAAKMFPEKHPMRTETLFDVASLTKVVATLPAVMVLVERGEIGLDELIRNHLPAFSGNGKDGITIRHLLTHTSGLPGAPRFYQYMSNRNELIQELYRTDLSNPTGSKVVYSDLGFILLGLLVEKISGELIGSFADRNIFRPLGMVQTCFNPPSSGKEGAAATEFFRNMGGYQCGEVHDRNAKVLGGMAGHAGLFSNIDDMTRYASMFLRNGKTEHVRLLKEDTLKEMTRNQTAGLDSSRGLGWVVYEPNDGSFGGCFRSGGYGHTGFTGTSLYINPTIDRYVILLTNRLHYGRTDDITVIRKQVHQLIADFL